MKKALIITAVGFSILSLGACSRKAHKSTETKHSSSTSIIKKSTSSTPDSSKVGLSSSSFSSSVQKKENQVQQSTTSDNTSSNRILNQGSTSSSSVDTNTNTANNLNAQGKAEEEINKRANYITIIRGNTNDEMAEKNKANELITAHPEDKTLIEEALQSALANK